MSDETLVRGVDFAFVMIRSFECAEEFYSGVLGLPCTARYREHGGEFETGNLTISMLEADAIGRDFAPSKGAIALRVDDVASARAELESRGVEFEGEIVDSGVCHQAYFADPDGNALILHHRYAPRPAPGE